MNEGNIRTDSLEWPRIDIPDIICRINKAKNAIIFCHINPDGDTVGAAFALRELIVACGGKASVACGGEIPRRLRFLCDGEVFCGNTFDVSDYDTVIAVDVASPGQLGELAEVISSVSFMIDHHGMGEVFAPHYVDACASAAGEIIYSVYKEMKSRRMIPALPNAARKIYASIVSDSGSFKQSNTTPTTHIIASELMEEINTADDGGMTTSDVCRALFGQRTLKELTAQMITIQSLRLYEDGRLGAVLITKDMLDGADLTEADIGNSVDIPKSVEGVLVGISLRQLGDTNSYKVSSRANTDIDVAAVCSLFGGGGHTKAAGCTISADTPEKALETAVDAFGEAIRNYTKLQETEK